MSDPAKSRETRAALTAWRAQAIEQARRDSLPFFTRICNEAMILSPPEVKRQLERLSYNVEHGIYTMPDAIVAEVLPTEIHRAVCTALQAFEADYLPRERAIEDEYMQRLARLPR